MEGLIGHVALQGGGDEAKAVEGEVGDEKVDGGLGTEGDDGGGGRSSGGGRGRNGGLRR